MKWGEFMENKIISKLRETKISERLLKSFFILSIVPIILMFLVVNTTTINLIKNNMLINWLIMWIIKSKYLNINL